MRFFLHRALEAILDQNECVFLQIKHLSTVLTREKKTESGREKKYFLGPRVAIFVTFGSFAKIRDRLPKLWISFEILLSMFSQYHRGI